jgi:probable rRNA maturation factor
VPKVFFHYADRRISLNNKANIRSFIAEGVFAEEKIALTRLDYIFCSDEYLLQINRDHLKHDYYTDIITFNLSEKGEEGITGEIYISVDRVKDNAKTMQTTFSDEALRVILHGALHLCGYKDKKKEEVKLMRQKEDLYIERYKKSST